ncbi:hypothetical protein QQF64_021549 [Cirrhinus molitorella]|uniref:Uncharacterized protein n=1 Tax=Cirrhinus molitorella TaxID=172907 RepID=A0ABR3L8A2_9TELE
MDGAYRWRTSRIQDGVSVSSLILVVLYGLSVSGKQAPCANTSILESLCKQTIIHLQSLPWKPTKDE